LKQQLRKAELWNCVYPQLRIHGTVELRNSAPSLLTASRRTCAGGAVPVAQSSVVENYTAADGGHRRKAADDEFVNKLVFEICNEINYPLPTPVASCLSQKYYHIYPDFNLLCIPLLESEFLLHIPYIYHEICHPLLSFDNPKVEPFQKNLGSFNVEVKKYFDEK
jgi:hypothetical protein